MNKNLYVYSLVIIFILVSCRTTKKINTAINKKDTAVAVVMNNTLPADSSTVTSNILEKITANKVDFDWFNAKIKISYEDNTGQNNDATAFVRIRKDSVIWISLTGLLGIEGFRALVTKDSITLMNKLKKQVQYRSINYLQDLTQLPFDFSTLQDFLLGNPIFFANNIISYKHNDEKILALSVGNLFKNLITVDTTTNYILHSKLDDADITKNRTCDITFDDYKMENGKAFSTDRRITVAEKSKLDIHLLFKQFSFDQPQSFPFNIPKNYKIN